MCGICGFVSKREIGLETLKNMNDTMSHRGPDDSGEEIFSEGGCRVGLGHRRLSIIDLSPLGRQPMSSYDQNVLVVFNGEIYNYQELREYLAYPFASKSDTEVIIAAYMKLGIDCVPHFNGSFAFALYDRREGGTLYLVLDRVGEKPLFYWTDGENIVFASELKPIMAAPGFKKEIRRDVLARYLCHLNVVAPDSIFKDVHKVPPGKILKFRHGQITLLNYWDPPEVYHEKKKTLETDYARAKQDLKSHLKEAVRLRLIADVPVGAFLSGGYDSSLVTALAQELSPRPLKTYSIGFEETKHNEAPYAKAVAGHLGTDHTELYISEPRMLDLVESIPQYYDEPFADSSQIPTMLVAALARREVTVALTGDGGDEFFCGYNHYGLMPAAQWLDGPGALVHKMGAWPVGRGRTLLDLLPYPVQVIAHNRGRETKTQFGRFDYLERLRAMTGGGQSCQFEVESSLREPNWQKRRMLLDMLYYIPEIAQKVDRACMKYALENRAPFLDVNVMEYSFTLDHRFKYSAGNKKRILKDLAYEYIPREMLDRRKTGFGAPIAKWLRTSLRERLEFFSDAGVLRRQGIFEPRATGAYIVDFLREKKRHPWNEGFFCGTVWSFFVFQQWFERYIGPL